MEVTKVVQGILISAVAAICAWWLVQHAPQKAEPVEIRPIILPDNSRDRHRPHLPWLPRLKQESETSAFQKIVGGGPIGPDGKTQVTCDLPVSERKHNVGGRDGAGLCVFTSIMHAARYQSEGRLVNFQDQMRKEPGGGYPSKVDAMIKKYGSGTQYVQYEGKDPGILKLALKTGRMPGVTYSGHDIHYRGSIAHMVNLVGWSDEADLAVILDNNFVGENELVWMSRQEFLQRWTGDGGWAVILLAAPPPPVPHN